MRRVSALIVTPLLLAQVAHAAPQGQGGGAAKAPAAGVAAPPAATAPAADKAAYVLYTADKNATLFSFDYGPPSSPAMALLGLKPDATPPSTSLTKFVAAVPALFGGKAGESVAFDFAPGALAPPSQQTFKSYANDYWNRLLNRTRISIAALNGDSGGSDPSKAVASKVAVGFSTSFLDWSDPLMTGRAGGGATFLQTCLAGAEDIAAPILATYEKNTLDQRQAAEARTLRGVNTELVAPVKPTPERMKVLRLKAAPYIPLAVPPPEQPMATAPPPAPPPDLSHQQHLLALQGAIANLRDEAGQSKEMQALLDAMSNVVKDQTSGAPASQPSATPAPPPSPEQPIEPALSDKDFAAAVLAELSKLEGLKQNGQAAQDKAVRSALDQAGVTAMLSSCADQASRTARFAPNFQVGGGLIEQGTPGRLENLKGAGSALWVAIQVPLQPAVFEAAVTGKAVDTSPTHALMAFASGRFGWREQVETGDKTTPLMRADTTDAWVGLEWLSPKYRVSGQYGWLHVKADDPIGQPFAKSGQRYLVSGQLQMGGDDSPMWVGLSYGNGYGTVGSLTGHTALVTVSFTPPKPPDLTTSK